MIGVPISRGPRPTAPASSILGFPRKVQDRDHTLNMHEVFLAEIAANNHDDTPCLGFANWVHENGDHDRVAFIRAQCRLAQVVCS